MESNDSIREKILAKLGEKYQYIGDIPGGSLASVYLVKHTLLDEKHVLKVMNSRLIIKLLEKTGSQKDYKKVKNRFVKEAKLCRKLNHPNIVKIYDVDIISAGIDNIKIPFFTMDYISGTTLKHLIKNKAPMELQETITILVTILNALHVIHQKGIVHRDLKPDNIMLDKDNQPILIDFGLAKDLLGTTDLTTAGEFIGTPLYMSPEQIKDSSNVGPRSDLYSMGAILYEMLVGESPCNRNDFLKILACHLEEPVPSIRSKRPELPPKIEEIIKKAMEKDEKNRFKMANEFLAELKQLI